MRPLDIAIAGCGIAGLAAAALLARAGHRIVVFDKLEAPAPLGSGLILQPVGLAVLDEIGVGVEMRALGARIERLYGRVRPSDRMVLDVEVIQRKSNIWKCAGTARVDEALCAEAQLLAAIVDREGDAG